MANKLRRLPTGNTVYGRLPRGCELCQRGLKSVVFLTGLCPANCFYCPLGDERRGRDTLYINEKPLDPSQPWEKIRPGILSEIYLSASLGAGITGGDPLAVPDRAVRLIKLLKEAFGKRFHIHLYTSAITLTPELASSLYAAGLDELRIHAPLPLLRDKIRAAREGGEYTVGLEYPALPGGADTLKQVIKIADEEGVDFVNINELEFTETNSPALRAMGYEMADDYRAAKGSEEAALEALRWAADQSLDVTVHYCPAAFKDHYQTGLRHYRRAQLTALPHQLVTDDGTLLEIEYSGHLHPHVYPPGKMHIAAPREATPSRAAVVEKTATHRGLTVYREPLMSKTKNPTRQE